MSTVRPSRCVAVSEPMLVPFITQFNTISITIPLLMFPFDISFARKLGVEYDSN